VKGTSLLTLYVAIIGLGTLAGILFNVLINKRLIFKILGIIITVITGTFACCVVLFPYYFFNSYNNLIIKLSLTAVLLIVIYISARMIVNACSSIKNKDKTEAPVKEVRKAVEPAASEIIVPDHALKNKVKSIISADKTPARSLTQKVSIKLDDAAPKPAQKDSKENTQTESASQPKAAFGSQPDKPSFVEIMKEADEKISSESIAESSKPAAAPQKQEVVPEHKAEIEKKQPAKEASVKKGAAAKQSLFEYEAEEVIELRVTKQEDEVASESKLGVQYEEPADITRDSIMLMIEKFSNTESKLDIQYEIEEESAEDVQAVTADVTPVEQAGTRADEGQVSELEAAGEEAKSGEAEAPAAAETGAKQNDPASAKYVMIISKARELMEQEKYAYAAELLQVCSERCEDTELKKQADISIIECFAMSGQKSEAQRKWIEFLNMKYILDEADKEKLKQVMRSM
jgi:hypothetical protein